MKKLLLILLCLPLLALAQTFVPDANFEAELEAQGLGDGIANNQIVNTALISTHYNLDISNKQIADLTGIQDFIGLGVLECHYNLLTSLDLSNNINLNWLHCQENLLTSLNVSSNTELEYLWCDYNQLTSLDLSNNPLLKNLICETNLITSLDLSHNPDLTAFWCNDNQLTSLDLRNGNNVYLPVLDCTGNPNLYCIDVDDSTWATINWIDDVDPWASFSTNCPPPSSIQEHYINKELLRTIDLLGRETKQTKQTNQPLFYIYDDGTVEKRIVIE